MNSVKAGIGLKEPRLVFAPSKCTAFGALNVLLRVMWSADVQQKSQRYRFVLAKVKFSSAML